MTNNFDVTLIVLIAGQIIGLCVFVWRVAIQYGLLQAQIERNRNDLNGAMLSMREDLRSVYQLHQMQISHIQEHLSIRDNYHPPSLRLWDKNFES
jgi:hypothetical protein